MKMNKRIQKVAVVSALTLAFAVPAFANPFSDVPAKHWAYDSVNKLAAAGVIDGYGDGTFKGDKTMTRYEMAQIVGKAMNKSLNADQQAAVDKLSREFATELNTMGVKVDGIQTQIDNQVKISGDSRLRYTEAGSVGEQADLRARVAFDGKINDDLRFNARLSGTTNSNAADNNNIETRLDTANVTFKDMTVGRQDMKLGSGVLFDDTLNGVALKTGALKMYAGKTTGGVTPVQTIGTAIPTVADSIYGAEYGIGKDGGAKLTADYMKLGDNDAYGVNGALPLGKSVTATGEYIKANNSGAIADGSATAFGVKFNQLGLSATHRDADAGVYNAYSGADAFALPTNVAIKGMEYQYDKNLGKNTNMMVKYQDFDNMDTRTSAAVNVKF